MNIGFDISQTGSGKAGCGYITHAMIKAMLAIAPQHLYALYPGFGDSFFDAKMPVLNPHSGEHVNYGPRHLTRETARAFWNKAELEVALGHPDVIHANNFWTPVQIASGRLIYTLYDVGFTENSDWTTETNRVDGIFRSSVAADWVGGASEYSRVLYLRVFPHFPSNRMRVVHRCSRFEDSTQQGSAPATVKRFGAGEFWLRVGTIEPRKNQPLPAQAYAQYLEADGRPIPLVLAGGARRHCRRTQPRCLRWRATTHSCLTPRNPEVWTQAMLDLASDQDKRHRLALAARARAKALRLGTRRRFDACDLGRSHAPAQAVSVNQTTSHTGDPLVEKVC
jgi:hypothetical protein